MNRRNLIKGIAAAGAIPMTGVSFASDHGEWPASLEPVVVDGLVAGTIRESYFDGMKKAGVHCAVAGGPRDFGSFTHLLDFFDARKEDLVHAKSVADIRRARAEGKYANVFGWHYAAAPGVDVAGLEGQRGSALRGFQDIGLRIAGLCFGMSHAFGGGNLGPHIPLTRAGRRFVEEIHRLSMVLDVGGHTGEQAALDAIAMAPDVPVICTRTHVTAIAGGAQCISDRLIDAVAATGGVIGLPAISDMTIRGDGHAGRARRMTWRDYVVQYDYIKRRAGIEHVGMGTASVEGLPVPRDRIRAGVSGADSVDELPQPVEGFERIEQFPRLVASLRQRGWSQPEIDLAMGENWLRVYEQVWGA